MRRWMIVALLWAAPLSCRPAQTPAEGGAVVQLPPPKHTGAMPVEETLLKRRSIRQYQNEPVSLAQIGQLAWAAQGITAEGGRRTAPSAGALYPLELYVVVGQARDLEAGIYKYQPRQHSLTRVAAGDKRAELAAAALGQQQIARGPVTFVFAGVYERTAPRYKERAVRYVHMEVGHAAQNLCLQAVALGLGSVVMGAFEDGRVKSVIGMASEENALYIVTVGKP